VLVTQLPQATGTLSQSTPDLQLERVSLSEIEPAQATDSHVHPSSRHSWRWLLIPAFAGLALWLLALWRLPQPPLLDRTLTRAEVIARGVDAAHDVRLSIAGLYGAAYPDTALLGLDTD